jgi:hypothetical protein
LRQPKNSATRRLVRRLGLTRNPLYRPVDRIDGAFRLFVVVMLVAVVGASVGVGLAAFSRTANAAARARQQLHRVTVVLVEDVPTGSSDASLGANPPRPGVQARWTLPDGSVHTGAVFTRAIARRGDSVSVWMNSYDDPVRPPVDRGDLMIRAALRALVVLSLGSLTLWATYGLAQRQLTRRRDAIWTKEWLLVSGGWRDRSF